METIELDPFEVEIGDTCQFFVAMRGSKGVVPDVDGAILDFGYGVRSDQEDRENADLPSANPELVTVPRCGKDYPALLIKISAAESSNLVPGVVYHWAARVSIVGVVRTVAKGRFTAVGVPL
jgi:hypothetical protein